LGQEVRRSSKGLVPATLRRQFFENDGGKSVLFLLGKFRGFRKGFFKKFSTK
jgi:hypothetical protein